MACNNCSETSIQFECGDSPRLICVQLPADPTAIPAWAVPVCNGEDELTGVSLFYDEAATVPLAGYTLANRVPCPQSLLGLSCASSVNVDLCPSSLNPILAAIDSAGEEIEEAIAAQTATLQASISAQTSAIQGPVESVGEEIEAAIAAQTAVLVNGPNYAYAYTYNGNGDIETITRTTSHPDFAPCEVQTLTYDGSFQLTGTSAWVACP